MFFLNNYEQGALQKVLYSFKQQLWENFTDKF